MKGSAWHSLLMGLSDKVPLGLMHSLIRNVNTFIKKEMRASEKLWRDFMIINSKEKVFQQRNPFLPPSLGTEAAYFLIATPPSMLTIGIPLHYNIPGVLVHPGWIEMWRTVRLSEDVCINSCVCVHTRACKHAIPVGMSVWWAGTSALLSQSGGCSFSCWYTWWLA